MLDVITDFWKPVRKAVTAESLRLSQLQPASRIQFGAMPQALLSEKRVEVSRVNTYQFGAETLTSFVLAQTDQPDVAMIVAEADGEHYLALSRRLSAGERATLFDEDALKAVMEKAEAKTLRTQGIEPGLQGWIVPSY